MNELKEKCGIFGVYGKGLEAAKLTYFGLFALQHRGQESSGIASTNGKWINFHKGSGLVPQVYSEEHFRNLKGYIAIGHNRYSTSGGGSHEHSQPVGSKNELLALAHNGNLPSVSKLTKQLSKLGIYTEGYNDSELMHRLIRYYLIKKYPLENAILESLPLFTGAYCLLIMTKDKLVAIRDPYGIRPFSIGKLDNGYVFSSETCALDTVNAKYIRDVDPGEMVIVDKNGLTSKQFAPPQNKLDIFEFIYFARPDSILLGKKVYEVRKNLGKELARENEIKADIVIPVPDSAIPAALGYSQESGIPFEYGLVKNRYIGRTFIMPEQHLRDRAVQMKLNPITEAINGKRVILVDDSIVRGTTIKKLVKMVRDAGAKAVHVMVSCPPTKFPDYYGIDTPAQEELIASYMTIPDIRKFLKCDSLNYLSYSGMVKATGLSENVFCTSCFTGEYPIDIGSKIKSLKGAKILPNKLQFKKGKIAVLISNKGTGSNLKAVINASRFGEITTGISLVISDKPKALGLNHAKENNIPYLIKIYNKNDSRDEYGKELADILNKNEISIAILAGFATILPPSYFDTFKGVTINIHPGLVPDKKNKPFLFPDGTKAPWNQGLIADNAVLNFLKLRYAGSTIHLATKETDFGPVLIRKIIKTRPGDSVETLYERLKKVEHEGLVQGIKRIVEKPF